MSFLTASLCWGRVETGHSCIIKWVGLNNQSIYEEHTKRNHILTESTCYKGFRVPYSLQCRRCYPSTGPSKLTKVEGGGCPKWNPVERPKNPPFRNKLCSAENLIFGLFSRRGFRDKISEVGEKILFLLWIGYPALYSFVPSPPSKSVLRIIWFMIR